jgi:hypothetical protein
MKGFKTLILNGLVVALGALLPWAAGIDWTAYVSPNTAALIVGAANILLRVVTTTPIGKSA